MKAETFLASDRDPVFEAAYYAPLKALLIFADGNMQEEWIEEETAPTWYQWLNDRRKRPHNFELRSSDARGLIYEERIF